MNQKRRKNQMIISEVKNTIADNNNSVDKFISRLESDKKRINKWKINQKKISIWDPRAISVTKMENTQRV